MTSLVILFILGLCIGSFVNAYVWRLHAKTKTGKLANLSIWHGRSMCPNCHHTLAPKDLVPVLSWICLKGKCRYCSKPISFQYPLIEIIVPFLFIFSFIYWPYPFNNDGKTLFIFWLVFLLGFMILFIYDFRWKLLPNQIVGPLIILAVVQLATQFIFFNSSFSLLYGAFWGVIFSSGLFYAIFVVSNGKWIGGGDVKLGIILGLLLGGPLRTILMVFLASIIGSLISVVLIFSNRLKMNSLIAFGPLLIIATIITYLFGTNIIDWYKNILI
jgi:prepilin signal peptidase PulO-like enzyme (type II secretory pathway)